MNLPRFCFASAVAVSALTVWSAHAAGPLPKLEPYVWRNVAIAGGGFVTGIVAHPKEKGLIYARTDVGGAYRWDAVTRRWIPLNDGTSETDWNLLGIESVAIDPNDPQRLFLAAGTYERFPAAILRSNDQGRTFARADVPIAMGGNEEGRFAGERLAVDPNDGRILLFGSRHDGLWRSTDSGASWERVQSFPPEKEVYTPATKEGRPPQHTGIVTMLFDPTSGAAGRPTPVVYAAVSTVGTSLFRSNDGGTTWSPVDRQPTGLRPNHLVRAGDGMLYLSYGREPGPGQITRGAVWKLNPRGGGWTDITPRFTNDLEQPYGFGCVAADPQHPATLLATTFGHWKPHDQIFRSTDAGATWTALWDDDSARWDYSRAPYTATRNPHWMGTIVIDPFDANHALFTTGYGIWASSDLMHADAHRPVHWHFTDDGLEETVPLALVSLPVGAHLLSGVGDIDGFRHEDIEASPAAGSFLGPRFASTRYIVFAASKPNLIVRIGNAGRHATVHAALSEDGGRNWQPLVSEPPGAEGYGRLALSADGKILVWALPKGEAFVTGDAGATWTQCSGITTEVALTADAVNPQRFYAFDMKSGQLMVSTDGGAHFAATAARVPPVTAWARGEVLAAMPGHAGDVWVGSGAAGLYHSVDAGATLAKIEAVQTAEALGFGMPAPGNPTPATYLRGEIGGVAGFYRSDDGGRTWVRINDDQHQFGAANRPMIIGDPRVYGRVYLTTGGRGIVYGDIASRE